MAERCNEEGAELILTNELRHLGMPDAQLKIDLNRIKVRQNGQDQIDIQFTSNKGQQVQDISKVASGGELSRVMLVIKAQMATNSKLPAIIFDEVDTGVSGDVADKMGNKIKELSSSMQVMSITHLPQIAAKASNHLYVFKELVGGKTVTKVKQLSPEERIDRVSTGARR